MDVSVESTGAIERRLTIKVPATELDQNIQSRLARLAKTVKLPGFRPGKVPLKVVEARFSEQVLQEAAEELIGSSYRDAVVQESVEAAGPPAIEPTTMIRGKDLEYVATLEVFPEIPRVDIKDRKIEKKTCKVESADVDRTIETLRKRRTTWEPGETPAAEDDRLLIDFKGTIDDQPFEGSEAENYPVVIGGGTMLKEFEEQLTGTSVGDSVTVNLTFPEDYPKSEIAGKAAQFTVEVREVGKPGLPELDEDFIKSFGVEEGTEPAFRKQILENLERERDQRIRNDIRMAVIEALIEDNEFDLPGSMVEEEVDRAVMASRTQLQQQGLPSDGPVDRDLFQDSALRRVKVGLVMHEIVKQREIKPDEAAVRKRLDEMASGYDDPQQFINWYREDRSRLAQIEAAVVEDQVVEALIEEAQVTETTVSFETFMNPAGMATAQ
ncbi:MAG TPA: trigger factor [Arenicellales bacterium]|jgi:trigger factor|nr:trigger factor [Arenicellales bacterium]MDP7221212.1 trigger factor [Arenicellales bacterium]HJP11753.1 trigger factor [Arenicellales bacterium]|tara:strand:+ start:277 stop:1593 length:1317 start_codon:yes stop_codon:yes gene_type:complete